MKRLRARRALARAVEALTEALEARDWPGAERHARAALEIDAPDENATIGPRYALASALLAQDRLEEAEESCRAAIALARRDPAASDPPLPQLLEQLAAILDRRGDRDAVETLLRDMAASYDRMRAPDPAEHATALERFALFLARHDRRDEAQPWFARAIAAHEAGLGGEALDAEGLAERLYNAASFHPHLEGGIPLFEQARALAAGHDLAARILHNLAAAYEAADRIDDARGAYRAALARRETRPTLVRLARLEHAAGDFAAAALLYERALVVARTELPADDLVVARIALWLGDARSEIFR
jgi:tetratricopeptide (TPR) repeat protein